VCLFLRAKLDACVVVCMQWLYPWSKDAGDPANAQKIAKSYNEYR